MSAKKQAWTAPGPIDQAGLEAAEARKGTAAAYPVLSLNPDHSVQRGTAMDGGHGAAVAKTGEIQRAQDKRSPAEIEADIERTRNRLAGTLDELTERLSPRAALRKANSTVRGALVTPEGAVRKDRAALAAAALAAVLGCVIALRLRHRG